MAEGPWADSATITLCPPCRSYRIRVHYVRFGPHHVRFGPKRTCRKTQSMSRLGVKRTWRLHCEMSAYASFRRAASWRVAPNEGFLKFAASVRQTNGEQSRL